MNSSNNNGPGLSKNESLIPKGKQHVSTMIGKKMAEAAKNVAKSAVTAAKKHNDKAKINAGN
ncbi:Hypothetical predicted protein [Olea europaea subsp. europaea]|uniref:Uncharacterized protein n=2 Tax=Olea europaea subsp. europaea TaxID=158383 RepID=A0A8S0TEV8_OLEEU|nr:Hypothetical predicted protein [Olea europaea subsp. europaea]